TVLVFTVVVPSASTICSNGVGATVDLPANRRSEVGASETTYGLGGGPVKIPLATGAPKVPTKPSDSFWSWNWRLAIYPDSEFVFVSSNKLIADEIAYGPSNPPGEGCSATLDPSINIEIVLVVS